MRSAPPSTTLVLGFVVLLLLAACSSSSSSSDEAGGGTGDGARASDGGAAGSTCGEARCDVGESCRDSDDCAGQCTGGACAEPTHDDGKKNLDETDIDCGGATAPACAVGRTCRESRDCAGLCTSGVCAEPTHDDGKRNLDETDIDCGGATAPGCFIGKECASHTDCNLGYCVAGACAEPRTDDGVKNGAETDIDCGGAEQTEGALVVSPPRCELTKSCASDGDCASAVCSDLEKCVEAPSCRPLRGGATCGSGESGQAGAVHESCCRTLPVAGMTMTHGGVSKQVYVDKYEITAGRVRAWVAAIKAEYGGVPNIRAWVQARIATDALVSTQLNGKTQYLPSKNDGESVGFPGNPAGATANIDVGLLNQLGPTSYYRGVAAAVISATSGCGMYTGAYGHRTYGFDDAERTYFNEIARPHTTIAQLDEKAMNCLTPVMYAAFCAWDGGYLATRDALQAAYGPANWPWGATPAPASDPLARSNFNNGVGSFSPANPPRYVFPSVNYGTFASDFTPVIAAPGRFPGDVSTARPAADSWMDLGGNMIEVVANGATFAGYGGASWEGHSYGRAMGSTVVAYDKYGKTGARCMRLR
ncbi:MAG: hypothetical protein KF850_40855 [Labilithrix sp.]|nr:hypothetical protein [Labilithrix sp.]